MTQVAGLEGKIALITGAARGIGFATAVELSRQGADIIGLDLPGSPWDELRSAVNGEGGQLLACEGDASDETTWQAVLAKMHGQFGRIDVLFNNAGIPGPVCALWDYPEDDFDRVMRVNCRGVFLGMK